MQHSIARELVNTATQLIKAAIETKDVSNFSVVHLSDLQGVLYVSHRTKFGTKTI